MSPKTSKGKTASKAIPPRAPANKSHPQVMFSLEQVRAMQRHARRLGVTVPQLVEHIVDRWLIGMEKAEQPKQLKLPTTDALNRLAVKARAARFELLDLAAKRNPPPVRPPTHKRVM